MKNPSLAAAAVRGSKPSWRAEEKRWPRLLEVFGSSSKTGSKPQRVAIQAGYSPVPGYKLVRRLGSGAFGEVWQAKGPGGTETAVKFITMAGSSGGVEWQAMQLAKRLRHANILPILGIWLLKESGELTTAEHRRPPRTTSAATPPEPSWLVVVMPLVDATLADRQRDHGDQKIPREQLMAYLSDAAKAIDYLTVGGSSTPRLQHCDIKPSNIGLLGASSQLIDFGLLQEVAAKGEPKPGGSPAYMAPERIRGEHPTATTDQYSLAISYCELRTGRLPFRRCSHFAIQQAHLTGDLDLSRLPAAERTVIRKATAIDPTERFESCVAFVRALAVAQRNVAGPGRITALVAAGTTPASGRETSNVAEATRRSGVVAPELPHVPPRPDKANQVGMKYYRAGDHAAAFAVFSQAAIAGHPAAQNNLGVCYLCGRGVAKREDLALLWFQRAAMHGHGAALDNIARYHATRGGRTSFGGEAPAKE